MVLALEKSGRIDPPADLEQRRDFIVAVPYSSNAELGPDNSIDVRLSVLSEIAIEAALLQQDGNPEACLVMPGETTFGPSYSSTTELMVQYAKNTRNDAGSRRLDGLFELPDGRPLNNTYRQVELLARYFRNTREIGTISMVGLAFHLPRVRQIAEAYGLNEYKVGYTSAEDVLKERGVKKFDAYLPFLQNFGGVSESALRFLTRFDRKGRLPDQIMQWKGARVNDICLDEYLRLVPYRSYANQRMDELTRELAARQQADHQSSTD